MSGAPFQWNPFSGMLDRVASGGGGGANITLTSQNGTPNTGNAFTVTGIGSANAQASATSNTDSTFTFENLNWETLYVVDSSTTPGTRGSFSTIQAALDAAAADGMAYNSPRIIRIRPGTYTENLTIPEGAFFESYAQQVVISGSILPVNIVGHHTIVGSLAVYWCKGINWQTDSGQDLFTASDAAVFYLEAQDCNFTCADGLFIVTPGTFDCQIQNCNFNPSNGGSPQISVTAGTVNFVGCDFNVMSTEFTGGSVITFKQCVNIGAVILHQAALLARECYFLANQTGENNVTQDDGSGSCKFINCTFAIEDETMYALYATGSVGQSFFINCAYQVSSVGPKDFTNSGYPIAPNIAMTGNVLNGVKVNTTPFQSEGSEGYIGITDTSSPVSVQLRQQTTQYQVYVADESGGAATNNITISDLAGGLINGLSSFVINENFGGVLLRTLGNGNWIAVLNNNFPQVPLFYGDGSDGSVTFDGTSVVLGLTPVASVYTLTRDLVLSTSVINSGVTINTAGYRIFCNGTLTNNGTIQRNGLNGTTGGNGGAALSAAVLGGSGVGANGATGAGGSFAETNSIGGNGGAGGAGTNAGGSTGTASRPSAVYGSYRVLSILSTGYFTAGGSAPINGGAGGSGGGGDNTNKGGGGGSGGGVIHLCVYRFAGTGSIEANGGNGGNGAVAGTNCGGGGGGGGGGILCLTRSSSSSTTIPGQTLLVNGGSYGTGSGTGANGSNGATGTIIIHSD